MKLKNIFLENTNFLFILDLKLLLLGSILISCLKDVGVSTDNIKLTDTPSITAEILNDFPFNYQYYGKLFESNDPSQIIYNTHSSWTHSNVFYDKNTKNIVVVYNVKPRHAITYNKVALRLIDSNGRVSNAMVIADKEKEGISCKSLSSGITQNGDYISLVSLINNLTEEVIGTYVYRSIDKGKSWNSYPVTVDKNIVKAFWGDVTGFLVLKTGRILTLVSTEGSRLLKILYSDDNGYSWKTSSIPFSYQHSEPAWCELSDGTIICYLRHSIAMDGYASPVPAMFMISIDSGLTWSKPVKSRSVLNMTEANGQLIYHEDLKIVEFIHHSRYTEDDGYSSIYQMTAMEDDAKNDKMGKAIRIMKLPAQDKGGDSGYIGGCKDSNNNVFISFYSGTILNADIYYIKGKKRTTKLYNN